MFLSLLILTIISLDPHPPTDPTGDIIMDDEIPIPPEDPTLLPHSCLLLLCYRVLSYFAWPKDFYHPRQRLLNCVAGGLHLSDSLINPILTAALATFSADYFSPPLTAISLFNKLSIGLPDSVLNALFPTTLPDHSFIPIPFFPQSTDVDQLKFSFSEIFNYMPPELLISITQSTLLFSSDNLALLHLPILAELLATTRKRTSEDKRPLVLKLVSIIVESDANDPQGSSPPLTIEKYHQDSCSVTIYDPHKGIYILPLATLLSYNIIAFVFKRSPKKLWFAQNLSNNSALYPLNLPFPLLLLLSASSPCLMVVAVLRM